MLSVKGNSAGQVDENDRRKQNKDISNGNENCGMSNTMHSEDWWLECRPIYVVDKAGVARVVLHKAEKQD